MFELINAHAPLWERVEQALTKQRIPEAMLFIGPRFTGKLSFAYRYMAMLQCQNKTPPCGQCKACHLIWNRIHPDIHHIEPEAVGGSIKIDQIREIHQTIYQSPKCGHHRFILIKPADRMNIAAANALLKVLEEPPSHTIFILIAEQMNSVPATIVSRCQKYVFPPSVRELNEDYLLIGQDYPSDSPRKSLMSAIDQILTALCGITVGRLSVCHVAAEWATYALEDLLWLLYLVTARVIHHQLLEEKRVLPMEQAIVHLSSLLETVQMFWQLDRIHAMMQKINHNMNMNQTLVLEDLLLGYVQKKGKEHG